LNPPPRTKFMGTPLITITNSKHVVEALLFAVTLQALAEYSVI